MRYTDWRVSGYDRPAAVSLVRAGYGPLVATVLSARGIRDAQTADAFLNAGTGTLPDPMELPGMRPAAERLRLAVERKERVAVFGDYDVDGITAGCLMRDYLRSKGVPCLLVIPECREDGYGLSQKSVDLAIEDGD
ncbi:MAG: single-stranded-DNA-specific exonuclease RecJ, partial [Oscillospiraceae bacterium]|nr:single-stranded-DNA-specific exonuclease RecJ [Oscillospiraceae bacterium]